MGLRIGTNIASITAQRGLRKALAGVQRSFRLLSTGRRSAVDDPAGAAISARMRAEIRGLAKAVRNGHDGISLIQVAEGGLGEITDILIRMRELSVQAANGTLGSSDRDSLQMEFSELLETVQQISQTTDFNGIQLLDGTGGIVNLQIGSEPTTNDQISITLQNATPAFLGLDGLDIGSTGDTSAAMISLDTALDAVSDARGRLGASQAGTEARIRALEVQIENLSAAESRIMDVDIAEETANLVKNQILAQASMAVLAQANLQPQAALQLIQSATSLRI